MNVKLSSDSCLFCQSKENTMSAKGKNFQVIVCTKHLVELLKREEASEAGAAIPAKV